MALIIRASSLFTKHYLKVAPWGVDYMETSGLGGRRKFTFGQIDCILMSPDNRLSFQVGQEVFIIQTNPNKPRHQQTIQEFTQAVGRSRESAGGLPVVPVV